MKVLCVCKSGNVRSVTLGRLLKKRGAEVLCTGVDKAFRPNTIQMLVQWADVVYAQKDSVDGLESYLYYRPLDGFNSDEQSKKVDTRFDVGPDDWKVPDHPDLLRIMRVLVQNDSEWSHRGSLGD